MSKENNKQLSSLSTDELKTKAVELESQMFKLRMQHATGQLGNTAQLRAARRELAQVKTFQAQKAKASATDAKGKR